MAEEMGSWRSLASSASRSIKGYVAQRDWKRNPYPGGDTRANQPMDGTPKPSLRQWAGQTLRAIAQSNTANMNIEKLALFPGWAHRRYHEQLIQAGDDGNPFDVELFVSGHASQVSTAGFETRSGRAFLFAAKMFAALPRVATEGGVNAISGNRTNDANVDDIIASMHLPPKPEDMSDEAEAQALTEQMRELDLETASFGANGSSAFSVKSDVSSTKSSNDSEVQRLHKNLETRFLPFMASSLTGRPIRISVYAANPETIDFKSPPLGSSRHDEDYAAERSPLLVTEILTGADGFFQAKVRIPWEKMATHPASLHVAFGRPQNEDTFYVAADLLAVPSRPSSPGTQHPYTARTPRIPRNLPSVTTTYLKIPITFTTLRLISDIDDTVKMSGILSGAKAAFYNVFVKDLNEIVIPGMSEWYGAMWKRGVRFHYVSNSPFQLLPVINEFLNLSALPPGSIKLRSYTGRRILSELFKAPAERKRAGIMDVLDSFPDSRFLLVGDSGEQDMELFATIARDRPRQVLAVFIRDASNWEVVKPLEDPTGEQALHMAYWNTTAPSYRRSPSTHSSGDTTPTLNGSALAPQHPSRSISSDDLSIGTSGCSVRQTRRTRSTILPPSSFPGVANTYEPGYFSSSPISSSPVSEPSPMTYPPPPSSISSSAKRLDSDRSQSTLNATRPSSLRKLSNGSIRGSGFPQMTDAEKKQYDLQVRVNRARNIMPENVPLRVFRDPKECVETKDVLDHLPVHVQTSQF
ncbi:hypothetical protein BDY19DRAFT_964089 [Irpex rosettiformis]|uniref:Uncharacterized protein n=1 Tax=Irpex rosettiformis TaxID=378272 RepID=A0ACB8TV36_9APHY|nr:hypothetical protein BDY19DRAFT_964089 [Irpex rosettiformis]